MTPSAPNHSTEPLAPQVRPRTDLVRLWSTSSPDYICYEPLASTPPHTAQWTITDDGGSACQVLTGMARCVILRLRPQKRSCNSRYRLRHELTKRKPARPARLSIHSQSPSRRLKLVICPAARPVVAAVMVTQSLGKRQRTQPT